MNYCLFNIKFPGMAMLRFGMHVTRAIFDTSIVTACKHYYVPFEILLSSSSFPRHCHKLIKLPLSSVAISFFICFYFKAMSPVGII